MCVSDSNVIKCIAALWKNSSHCTVGLQELFWGMAVAWRILFPPLCSLLLKNSQPARDYADIPARIRRSMANGSLNRRQQKSFFLPFLFLGRGNNIGMVVSPTPMRRSKVRNLYTHVCSRVNACLWNIFFCGQIIGIVTISQNNLYWTWTSVIYVHNNNTMYLYYYFCNIKNT